MALVAPMNALNFLRPTYSRSSWPKPKPSVKLSTLRYPTLLLYLFFVAENPQQNIQQTSNDPNVDAAWNGMKTHVFGGGQKGTAGTHLTQAWKAKDPNAKLRYNEDTGLSVAEKVCTLSLGLCIQFS